MRVLYWPRFPGRAVHSSGEGTASPTNPYLTDHRLGISVVEQMWTQRTSRIKTQTAPSSSARCENTLFSAFAASLTHQLLSKFFLSSSSWFLPGLVSHERGAASCGAVLQRTLSVAATQTEPQKYVALVFTGVIPRLFQRVIKGVTELCSDQRTKRQKTWVQFLADQY